MTAEIEALTLIWFMVGYFTVILIGVLYDYNWMMTGKEVNTWHEPKEQKINQNKYKLEQRRNIYY